MYTEFETAAFSMKVGEISSKPVKTQAGYHVIQVLGHENRPLSASDFETYKDNTFQDWLTTQEKASTITKYDKVWQANVPTVPDLSTSNDTTSPATAQ
jgi:peptidyl-prolyl cis-trans isomerase C